MVNNVIKLQKFQNKPTSITAANTTAVKERVLKTSLLSAMNIKVDEGFPVKQYR